MNLNRHSYLMIGLLVAGAALFFTGLAGGSILFLLWPVACMAMMLFMMRGMMGTKGDSEPRNEADHDVRAPVDAKNGRQDR